MSSEVCPFCGKTYKRLKSHLPHCKAPASSKTPPTKHDVTVNQTTPSPQLDAASSEPAAKGKKSAQTLSVAASPRSKKSERASVVSSAPPRSSSPATPSQSADTPPSSPLSRASLPPSTKKKKQKPSELIKTANISSAVSLVSSPSPPPSAAVSEPKKKSLRALIEAAKSKQVSKGTRSAAEDLPSGPTPLVADPLSSRSTAQTEDDARPAFLSTDIKPKGPNKKKASKTKKAAQPVSTTKGTSSSLDPKVNESSARPRVRDDFWVDNEGEIEDLSVSKMLLKSGSGHQARITLQDVKATLGRANGTRQSSRPSILSQIQTTDLNRTSRLGTSLSPAPTKTLSDQLPSNSSQHTELQSAERKSSTQAPLIPLRHDGSPRPAAPLLSGHLSSRASQAASPPPAAGANEGPAVGRRQAGPLTMSPSLTQSHSPHLFLLAPQTLPAGAETPRADGAPQLEVRKQNTADNGAEGALAQRRLAQVRLKELPKWLVYRAPRRPRDVVEMVQRGWQWYFKKYIDVKKGHVGGLSMLLAGYCVLSYIWSYPRLKRDRWRKYH